MKSFILVALVANASATGVEGAECYTDAECDQSKGFWCVDYVDGEWGPLKSCEDCQGGQNGGNRKLVDSYSEYVDYQCPESSEPPPAPDAPPPAPDSEAEKASMVAASVAALFASASLMI